MLEEYLSKYKFRQLEEYVKLVREHIVTEESSEKYSFITINAKLKNNLDLKVLITSDSCGNDWVTFYLKRDSLNVEQIEFMISDDDPEKDYNRVIRHDYFTVEDEIATTFNSGYVFIDDNYRYGWEDIRKVNFSDISHYAGHDNLANFACHIDNSSNRVLYKESSDNVLEPEINLIYLADKKELKKIPEPTRK